MVDGFHEHKGHNELSHEYGEHSDRWKTRQHQISVLKQISECEIDRIVCDGEHQIIILLKDGIRTRSGDRCIVKNQIGVQFQMVIATLEPASY